MSDERTAAYFEMCVILNKRNDEIKAKDAKISELEKRVKELEGALDNPELKEKLAWLEHSRWSGWIRYQFDVSTPEKIEHWKRLMNTDYSDLPEHSKEADRNEVRKTLAVIKKALSTERGEGVKRPQMIDRRYLRRISLVAYLKVADCHFEAGLVTDTKKAGVPKCDTVYLKIHKKEDGTECLFLRPDEVVALINVLSNSLLNDYIAKEPKKRRKKNHASKKMPVL